MICVTHLNKNFGEKKVLQDICFSLPEGKVLAIIGPSGSGKSTLLRCLNFLESPTAGSIRIDNVDVDAGNINARAIGKIRKKTAMVFQHFNLFKNMNVLENVMLGLTAVKRLPKQEAKTISTHLIEKVGLSENISSFPYQLSGGQQQRVGIARALAVNPSILLFDEPTSALDPELVNEVLSIIRQLAEEKHTMIIVTHELHFAYEVADYVLFLSDGKIEEYGTAESVFTGTQNERTKKFLSHFSFQYQEVQAG